MKRTPGKGRAETVDTRDYGTSQKETFRSWHVTCKGWNTMKGKKEGWRGKHACLQVLHHANHIHCEAGEFQTQQCWPSAKSALAVV